MRRLALCSLFVIAAACSTNDNVGPRSSFTADQAAAARAACQFTSGTLPGLSLAKDAPLGKQIPIDTIVVLMFENRSFDHLLGHLPDVGVTDVDVAPQNASNPASNGTNVPWYHDNTYCFCDTNHEWTGSHDEYDNGKNDGFVKANENNGGCPPDGTRAMSYYTKDDLPYVYDLAKTFSVSDRNFCSLLGPTFPNREYLYAATSYGMTYNQIFDKGDPKSTVMELLDNGKVTWADYYEGVPNMGIFLVNLSAHFDNAVLYKNHFLQDAAAGTLPPVVFLDPNTRDEYGGGDDFHPPGDPQEGEAFLKQALDALMQSPQWPHMAVFITFDENGGLYDHVAPPAACPPDNIAAIVQPGGVQAGFDRYGFRVPLIVVSPYAKPGHVSHVVSDHTSILRFIEARFNLPSMTARDANADPLFDMFDFSKPALLTPPQLAQPNLDQAKLTACTNEFPDKPIFPDGGAMDLATPDLAEPVDGGATD